MWQNNYNWEKQGNEWSQTWGTPRMEWFATLLPRLQSFVPANSILEIAPGYGRWTHFLKDLCKKLTVVDLSAQCIQACQKRFSENTHITYHVNDGKSLDMIEDNSLDFVFSFDSLVHAEDAVLETYLDQLSHKLKKDGAIFMHHSNLGSRLDLLKKPEFERAWRDTTMTAEKFSIFCDSTGLQCISQELINWANPSDCLIDCFSIAVPKNSKWSRPLQISENGHFMAEAKAVSKLAPLYDFHSK
ncbi:class I SAM-dependent methyltransferase [bacterium]|nr:class I SAM-dependent methyltransferase [bacterium]